jgi:hypothetical protein
MGTFNYSGSQVIKQLEARKGGYFYLTIDSEVVEQMPKKRATRLICSIGVQFSFPCGLNHLGNGNFFIIFSKKNLDLSGLVLGQTVKFELSLDPNPLGVEVPEVLEALIQQDNELKTLYEGLTDGKKRNIIHSINRIKNIDLQIERAEKLIKEAYLPRKKRSV